MERMIHRTLATSASFTAVGTFQKRCRGEYLPRHNVLRWYCQEDDKASKVKKGQNQTTSYYIWLPFILVTIAIITKLGKPSKKKIDIF